MLTLYSMQLSANSYKVRLLLSWLGRRFELVEVDVLSGGHRTSEFLTSNPTGQVPMLVLTDGRHLPESGAILHYLAEGTPLLPAERFARAEVLRWMFFEQHSHDPFIGQARWWLSLVRGGRELKRNLLEEWEDRGYQALRVMDTHLTAHPYFAGDTRSIADIALYANTHLAHEGDFDLAPFPAVRAWLARIETESGHVPITWAPQKVSTAQPA